MSYPTIDDYSKNKDDILLDLSIKKEFNIFGQQKQTYKNTEIDNRIIEYRKIILNSYQNFVNNFININTPYTRLLLMHGTGTGKTISALNIAQNFIEYYKKLNNKIGNVFILGFTKGIFKRELLRPEFGIITKEEYDEFLKVKELVVSNNLKKDIEYLKEIKNKFNRKISKYNIEFYGYKEFVNRLFIIQNSEIKLTNLNETEILQYLKNSKIKLNEELLNSFKNSLLICDEIHNVYNSLSPNNWGIAIQIVLDYHSQYGNTLRSLFLSATPINNHYIETISILNLLLDYDKKIHKNELFDKNNNFLPNSEELIKNLSINKISYIQDINTQLYPKVEFIGKNIKNIEYLKFIKCPMSKLHLNTYINIKNETDIKDNINEIVYDKQNKYPIKLPLDQLYINDYVLPNPNNDNIGLFKSIDINSVIRNAPQDWKTKNKIQLINDKNVSNNYIITGNFMLKENIKKYSNKYYTLLESIEDIIKNKKGKIFIYHNYVSNSGILFIQEMLKINGYLDNVSSSTSNTICSICGNIRKIHENKKLDHKFKPVRFITIHSEIQKNIIENNIDIFNLPSNADGDNIKIILGSRAIKESYDLKCIRNVIITSCPDNISTLIQIIGRAVRKNSHKDLPKNKRNVEISLLVNSIHNNYNTDIDLSHEETKYKNKINVYKNIQKIENIFIHNSIDSLVNQNIYETHLTNNLFYTDYKQSKLIELDNKKLDLTTFIPYHIKNEINIVKYIIKRLFIEVSNIWEYSNLYKYVKNPPFHIEMDCSKISEDSFIIALDFLVYNYNNAELIDNKNNNLVNNLFDNNTKIIIDLNNNKKVITYIDKYYILTSYNENELIQIQLDEPFRKDNIISEYVINLDTYIDNYDIENNYNKIKTFILEKYKNYNFNKFVSFLYDYDINIHKQLIEDIIEYFYKLYILKDKKNDNIHLTYFNLLYYYNKFNLILFANTVSDELYEKYYKNITEKSNEKEYLLDNIIISSLEEELIMSSGNLKDKENIENKKKDMYKYYYKLSEQFLNNKQCKKILDFLLPVGHILDNEPKIYTLNTGWIEVNIKYSSKLNYIDNDIIVGYNSKEPNSIDIKFKIKPPSKKIIKVKDNRTIQTGVVCLTKDKKELFDILEKLNPSIKEEKYTKKELCNMIKRELIIKELVERKKGSNIKYYYLLLE